MAVVLVILENLIGTLESHCECGAMDRVSQPENKNIQGWQDIGPKPHKIVNLSVTNCSIAFFEQL